MSPNHLEIKFLSFFLWLLAGGRLKAGGFSPPSWNWEAMAFPLGRGDPRGSSFTRMPDSGSGPSVPPPEGFLLCWHLVLASRLPVYPCSSSTIHTARFQHWIPSVGDPEWFHYPAYSVTATHIPGYVYPYQIYPGIFVSAREGQLLDATCFIVTNTFFRKLIQTKHDGLMLMCHLSGSLWILIAKNS